MLPQSEVEQLPNPYIHPHSSIETPDNQEEKVRDIGPSLAASALIVAEVAGIIDIGVMVPIAIALGCLQVTHKYPPPPELNKHIASRDITNAINCVSNYAYNNAHHLLDEDNIAGNTVKNLSAPIKLGKLIFSKIFTDKPCR